jgi:hypothetical protein
MFRNPTNVEKALGAAFFIAASYFTLNAPSRRSPVSPVPLFLGGRAGLFVFGDRFFRRHKVFFRSGRNWFWTILFFI